VYCHYQSDWYTLSKTMDCALRLVLFSGGAQQLLGGFWFLSSLFWATLYSMTFLWVLKKMNKLTLRYISGGGNFNIVNSLCERIYSYRYARQVVRSEPVSYRFLLVRIYEPTSA
jgi:hypothetical protein